MPQECRIRASPTHKNPIPSQSPNSHTTSTSSSMQLHYQQHRDGCLHPLNHHHPLLGPNKLGLTTLTSKLCAEPRARGRDRLAPRRQLGGPWHGLLQAAAAAGGDAATCGVWWCVGWLVNWRCGAQPGVWRLVWLLGQGSKDERQTSTLNSAFHAHFMRIPCAFHVQAICIPCACQTLLAPHPNLCRRWYCRGSSASCHRNRPHWAWGSSPRSSTGWRPSWGCWWGGALMGWGGGGVGCWWGEVLMGRGVDGAGCRRALRRLQQGVLSCKEEVGGREGSRGFGGGLGCGGRSFQRCSKRGSPQIASTWTPDTHQHQWKLHPSKLTGANALRLPTFDSPLDNICIPQQPPPTLASPKTLKPQLHSPTPSPHLKQQHVCAAGHSWLPSQSTGSGLGGGVGGSGPGVGGCGFGPGPGAGAGGLGVVLRG